MIRQAYVGERIRVPIKVQNKTKKTRTFQFDASEPLTAVTGETAGSLQLEVQQLTLEPLQTALLNASVDVSEAFKPGFAYTKAIAITSERCEPQRLYFTLRVLSEDAAPLVLLDCPCHPPVRPIHWSEHFYCDRPKEEETEG